MEKDELVIVVIWLVLLITFMKLLVEYRHAFI
jgi:hypothetical protein